MNKVTETHVYFWGTIFSNWSPVEFKYKNHIFHNSEQAFMWEKANYFNDIQTANMILKTSNPRLAKKLGRNVTPFDPDKWNEVCYKYMLDVNIAKYSQNIESKNILLSTENKIIVEASPYDRIWGVGLHWNDDKILNEKNWKGQNLLGKVLMEVRKNLNKKM